MLLVSFDEDRTAWPCDGLVLAQPRKLGRLVIETLISKPRFFQLISWTRTIGSRATVLRFIGILVARFYCQEGQTRGTALNLIRCSYTNPSSNPTSGFACHQHQPEDGSSGAGASNHPSLTPWLPARLHTHHPCLDIPGVFKLRYFLAGWAMSSIESKSWKPLRLRLPSPGACLGL